MKNLEIIFRGVSVKTGEKIYGYLFEIDNRCFILLKDFYPYADLLDDFEVLPESVGQYTGLDDMNGTKIFTGDYTNHLRLGVGGVWEFSKKYNCFLMIDMDEDLPRPERFFFSIDSKDLKCSTKQ